MDAIFAKIAEETTNFGHGVDEYWRDSYQPFHQDPAGKQGVVVVKDVTYGSAERNQLDIYFPEKQQSLCPTEGDRPVLLYLHGGGFFSGDKGWSENFYGNVGYYFAQRGMVVVLANHRLVPHATYPQGAEDVRAAREWVYENIAADAYGRGDRGKVVIFGHSSGGAHVAMDLYREGDPNRAGPTVTPTSTISPPVAGIIYMSVPWWFDRQKPVRQKTIRHYFGSDEESVWGPLSPLGLFKNLPDGSPYFDSEKLPIYIGSVKWETQETADANVMFFNAYRARSQPVGSLPEFHVLDRHNHLTNVLSIGTKEDTAQGEALLRFIWECVRKVDSRRGS